jgi:hypothetical protein
MLTVTRKLSVSLCVFVLFPAYTCWPVRQRSRADMRILWICRATAAGCQVLHWKSGHKIGYKRKGRVDFALFNIHASLNLDA